MYAFDERILCIEVFFDGILSNDDEWFCFEFLNIDISSVFSSINEILTADFNRLILFERWLVVFLCNGCLREESLVINLWFFLYFIGYEQLMGNVK